MCRARQRHFNIVLRGLQCPASRHCNRQQRAPSQPSLRPSTVFSHPPSKLPAYDQDQPSAVCPQQQRIWMKTELESRDLWSGSIPVHNPTKTNVFKLIVLKWSAGEGGVLSGGQEEAQQINGKRASSVCGFPLDSIEMMGEKQEEGSDAKLSTIMDNTSPNPLHQTVGALSSSFSTTDSDTQGVGRSASTEIYFPATPEKPE
ncbi:hypothetical protein L3Q82_006922 [Scortum barcoo]|uniref:Uncharacterized protein n=1 Tax=Scortum barcoo TaxID=214431 RepID=A0ACB8WWF6_9TELE|nr:hypothetical protein L3Q82_006922 [Scortum barcoo]